MKSKYKVRDKVRFRASGKWRVPDYIRKELRQRTRTVAGVYYDEKLQCNLYDIGARGKGVIGYLFRCYQLIPSREHALAGRPRRKRIYKHRAGG